MNMRTIVYLLGIFLIFACDNRVKFEESTNESEIDIPKSEARNDYKATPAIIAQNDIDILPR